MALAGSERKRLGRANIGMHAIWLDLSKEGEPPLSLSLVRRNRD